MKRIVMIIVELPLKNSLLALVASVFLAACSTPKYTYYFSKYTVQNNASVEMKNVTDVDSVSVSKNESSKSFLLPVQKEALLASTSKNAVVLAGMEMKAFDQSVDSSLPVLSVSNKKGIVKRIQALIKKQATIDDGVKNGNKKKNGFAVIGFILATISLAAIILGLISINGGLLLVGLAAAIVGVVFSFQGIRSEKRGFSIFGICFGFSAIAVLLIAYFSTFYE